MILVCCASMGKGIFWTCRSINLLLFFFKYMSSTIYSQFPPNQISGCISYGVLFEGNRIIMCLEDKKKERVRIIGPIKQKYYTVILITLCTVVLYWVCFQQLLHERVLFFSHHLFFPPDSYSHWYIVLCEFISKQYFATPNGTLTRLL